MGQRAFNSRFLIKVWMTIWFIAFCLKLRINPWRFFQMNAPYFNKIKGIYSKLEINLLIPRHWRLEQLAHHKNIRPQSFPVFIKPEWGQNSQGIYRADSPKEFEQVKEFISEKKMSYLHQEAATEKREFEIYYIRQADRPEAYATLTVTEVINDHDGAHPINGVNNSHTTYSDLSKGFMGVGMQMIWNHVRRIGNFRMARVCAKANSETDLLKGSFHIVEINLFTPMPLNLLDNGVPWREKLRFIHQGMRFLAENARALTFQQKEKNIFFSKLTTQYRIKS